MPGSPFEYLPVNTIDFPSLAQFTSPSEYRSSGSSTRTGPPSLDNTSIFDGLRSCISANAISFPSGDHRGRKGTVAPKLSLRFSVPSNRLRHNSNSGYVTYVTHCLSREMATSVAEIPPKYGTRVDVAASYRTS